MIEDSLVLTGSKVLVYDNGVSLISNDGKVLGAKFSDVYARILGLDLGTDLVSLDELFDGSNDSNIEVFFLEVY